MRLVALLVLAIDGGSLMTRAPFSMEPRGLDPRWMWRPVDPVRITFAPRLDGGWNTVACTTGRIEARVADTGVDGPTLLEVRCP